MWNLFWMKNPAVHSWTRTNANVGEFPQDLRLCQVGHSDGPWDLPMSEIADSSHEAATATADVYHETASSIHVQNRSSATIVAFPKTCKPSPSFLDTLYPSGFLIWTRPLGISDLEEIF